MEECDDEMLSQSSGGELWDEEVCSGGSCTCEVFSEEGEEDNTDVGLCNGLDIGGLDNLVPPESSRDFERFLLLDLLLRRNNKKEATDVYLFGRAVDGGNICVVVSGWQPYFFVRAPSNWSNVFRGNSTLFCSLLEVFLEDKYCSLVSLKREILQKKDTTNKGAKQGKRKGIHSISIVQKKSIFGYSPSGNDDFIKIEMVESYGVQVMKDCFEGCVILGGEGINSKKVVVKGMRICVSTGSVRVSLEEDDKGTETYDANVDSTMQFMVDSGLHGCQWCGLKSTMEGEDVCTLFGSEKKTQCSVELRTYISNLEPLSVELYNDLGSLRILSFDIEAAGRRGVFPEASIDPVIQISLHFRVLGVASDCLKPILLSLRSCDAIDGVDVICFDDELELLRAFSAIVNLFDADVFTGYNICNFDFPYLQKRARVLEALSNGLTEANFTGRSEFEFMTRMKEEPMRLRETVFQSVQTGKRKRTRVTIQGRVCLDMMTSIQNNQSYRLERYSLNAVSEFFLGDQKVDLPFTQITPMWEKDSFSRAELGKYCVKDAQLPIDLMVKIDALTQTIEMARCTGIPFDWVLQRGIMVRNTSLLLRRALTRDFVFPNISRRFGSSLATNDKYKGATVLDAHAGIHNNVGVLDFSAMYPSIIRAHNLCYSTIVLDSRHVQRERAVVVPYDSDQRVMSSRPGAWFKMNKNVFVPDTVAKGLIPEVVEYLQICRNKAKKAYSQASDEIAKKTCKAREMAFKVAGNGMYGSLGSTQSLLPLLAIAETVTAIGRCDIQKVKSMAESMFSDCLVVYGDTDSVFVRFHLDTEFTATIPDAISKTSEMSILLVEAVNSIMQSPKKIEFEKAYSTMLCLSKKRYAGVMYANGHVWGTEPPIDIKGMQCVRRDGCGLTRDLVRDCLMSILHTGSHMDAASIARKYLNDIFDDKIPIEQYAIRKVLRKSMQDCCHALSNAEVESIRLQLNGVNRENGELKPLTYAEQDDAIRRGIKIPWKPRIRLPHILLAWRMRLKDPGSAPVLGESISYVVTNNGGKQIYEKVETLEYVKEGRHYIIDKQYYLDALRVPLENIFLPVFTQIAGSSARAKHDLEVLIWAVTKRRVFKCSDASRKAISEESPIARAFKRQK